MATPFYTRVRFVLSQAPCHTYATTTSFFRSLNQSRNSVRFLYQQKKYIWAYCIQSSTFRFLHYIVMLIKSKHQKKVRLRGWQVCCMSNTAECKGQTRWPKGLFFSASNICDSLTCWIFQRHLNCSYFFVSIQVTQRKSSDVRVQNTRRKFRNTVHVESDDTHFRYKSGDKFAKVFICQKCKYMLAELCKKNR